MNIPSPTQFVVTNESDHHSSFVIEPFYPGYGTTVGNALRRVLLSSLEGCAISGVNIKGVSHEFTTLPGVKEDFVDIMMNLKGVVVQAEEHVDLSSLRLELSSKGEGVVSAGDIEVPTGVSILNPKHALVTLTSPSSSIEMEISVSRGRGFLPIENREHESRELGFIAIDSLYSPVLKVGFSVEDVRVGQMTNYDKVRMDVETNGSISPREAVEQSMQILIDQFQNLNALAHDSQSIGQTKEVSAEGASASDEAEGGKQAIDADEVKAEDVSSPEETDKPKKRSRKKKEE